MLRKCEVCPGYVKRQERYCDRHRRTRVQLPNGFGSWVPLVEVDRGTTLRGTTRRQTHIRSREGLERLLKAIFGNYSATYSGYSRLADYRPWTHMTSSPD